MASSYTGLGTELMTTGENAGTWGSTTNTNLQIIEQISGGYEEQAISGTTTTLSVSDGSAGAVLAHRIIKFTGTLSANSTVTIPLDVQQMYILVNGTGGAYTLTFKYVSGSGSTVAFAATDKGTKLVYATADDSTDPNMVDSGIGSTAGHDLDGNELILDADADTSITADTDDQIDIKIAGADDFQFTANTFTAQSGSTIAAQALTATTVTASGIVKTDDTTEASSTTDGSLQTDGGLSVAKDAVLGDDVKLLSDSAVLSFGADSDTTFTHTDGTGLTLNGTNKLCFYDTALSISSSTDGQLDLIADTEIQIAATTIDINGAVALNGAITGATDITLSGELDAATLDISGNADIDGTTNLDAVDIDGAVQIDATFTSGVDGQGYDTKFFGDTSSAYMLWDTSADDLVFAGAAGIDLAGDIDVDGTANLDAVDIDGAVQIDNTVTVGENDTGYDVKFFGDTASAYMLWDTSTDDLVLAGAAGIDLAGDIDVDGTANLDAVDIDGAVQLDSTLTVGANDQGYDIKFFGDTASAYMLWDTSADDLVLAGAAGIDLAGDIDVDGTANLDNTDIDGTLAVDGTTISLDATTSLNIDNSNTSNGITIGTATSSVPISIGHATSEVTVNDNLTVTGDLTISGTTTTVSSTTVAIADSMLNLAKDQGTSSDAVDFGFYGTYGVGGTAKYAGIFRDLSATGDPFTFFDTLEAEPGTTVNTGGTGYDLADIAVGGATFADDIDVDGTANLDAVDIDGAVQLDSTFTVGVDDQGYDVKLFGDTASAYMLWDTSADDLILGGGAGLVVPEGQFTLGSTAVTSTATELNIVDGGTSATGTTLVNADRLVVNDNGTMVQVAISDVKTYLSSAGFSSEDPTALAIALG